MMISRQFAFSIIAVFCMAMSVHLQADEYLACLNKALKIAKDDTPAAEIRAQCFEKVNADLAFEKRFEEEELTQKSEFVMTPYRQNYILLGTYNDKPNQTPFEQQDSFSGLADPLKEEEVKLQISFKVPLNQNDLLLDDDGLYFGFTLKAFWQLYNKRISAPFRETNYRPEIYYQAPLDYRFMDGGFFGRLGFEHESNGRSQYLSRSWNRIYAGLGYQRENWIIYVQPWYRLPESEKEEDGDPNTPPPAKGDDNPDINDFMGHYEFFAVYTHNNFEVSSRIRQNFSTGKGALELGFSFPMYHRLKGYVQFFNGYGESLIDYDHSVQRIGIGILLTDFL